MALAQLSEEQIRTWTLEQKDRWWLANVFKGDMPQLTLRASITGFLLGGVLSATNLYVGAKTGWTLGVGLTSVVLAFALFKIMAQIGAARDFTILENNAMQSIATAAGYMTAPLISSIAAYMMVTNVVVPWWQMITWNAVLSILGVLIAFPLKRRFINDEQLPFPEGRACGVVLDTLYTSEAATGIFKAKALTFAAIIAAGLQFLVSESFMKFVQFNIFRFRSAQPGEHPWHIKEAFLDYYYAAAEQLKWGIPKILNIDIRQLSLAPALDLAMVGAGGLMGFRTTGSLMLGAFINYAILCPLLIHNGYIAPKSVSGDTAIYGYRYLLTEFSLWWGVAIMVVASLVAFFAKPDVIFGAFKRIKDFGKPRTDILGHIELPLWVSAVGVPIFGAIAVWMTSVWFDVAWYYGALAIPLIFVLTLIAVNATALTSITPGSAISRLTQFTFGPMDPKNPATNLMTAGMSAEVALNASNLLMDIKPGYMLGAKPRQQAIGHVIGIFAGALFSTPLFFLLFLQPVSDKPNGGTLEERMTQKYPMTSAVTWKGVSDLITAPAGGKGAQLSHAAILAMSIAAFLGVAMEVARIITKGRFPLSPVAIGLGVIIQPESTYMMFVGSLFFWLLARLFRKPGTRGHTLWVDTQDPICAGLIAGWSLTGIGDKIVKVFVLGE